MTEELKEPEKEKEKDSAASAHIEKILKEKRNAMAALEEERKRIEDLEAKIKEMEQNALIEKENFKELYERSKQESESVKSEYSQFKTKYYDGIKFGALRQELIKQGASESRIDSLCKLVDISKLKYNDEHKVVLGADDEAKMLKEKLPELFGTNVPSVSHDQPGSSNIAINTLEEFKKLPIKEQTPEKLKELGKKLGVDFRL